MSELQLTNLNDGSIIMSGSVCVCVCVCVLSHLHPCGETHAYKMVLWGVLTLWGNESLPHKE